MAGLYDTPDMAAGYARSRPAVHPLILDRVRARFQWSKPLGRALDVGCGAGMSTRPLLRIARHAVGIEPVEAMLRWSSEVAPGAWFAAGAAEALPLRSHSADLITAAGSLNYADLGRFFPEAARVLCPGGVLVVYDFSQGSSFRGSKSLDNWFAEFVRRYPPPNDSGSEISPASLESCDSGFRVSGSEEFEIGLELEPGFYLDYVMTETNVAHAIRNGVPAPEIRAWCGATLAPVFEGRAREVLFRGYFACMVPK